ncbi:MAG: hypothetical protein J5965_12530 [Aeriscardovia sp.]|nr:hypothetical protein [Aeriscardovia sp.]
MDKEKQNNQFHPPACAALELEFRENRDDLEFTPELQLNKLPNRVDVVVVKKSADAVIKSGLGAIFRKYNLWEYKSPGASLNVKTYFKMTGYAGLYLANLADTDDISEITLSFMRDTKPVKLLKWFDEHAFTTDNYQPGIYHIKRSRHCNMQIIVTSEVDAYTYQWVTMLSPKANEEALKTVGISLKNMDDTRDLQNAETVFDLFFSICSNEQLIKEKKTMGITRDMFKEEFESRDRTIATQAKQLKEQGAEIKKRDATIKQQGAQILDLQAQIDSLRLALNAKQG